MDRMNPKHSPAQTREFSQKLLDLYFKQVVQPPGSIFKSIDLTDGCCRLTLLLKSHATFFLFSPAGFQLLILSWY